MPIYLFACMFTGETKEEIMPLSDWDVKEIKCPIHCRDFVEEVNGKIKTNLIRKYPLHNAERIPARLGLVSGISQTTSTIIFRNASNPNDIRVAVYKNQEVPHGFIKEELKTPMERSRVEREMAKIQDAQDDFDTAKREFVTDHVRKERHADLNARMNSLTKDAENPEQAKALLKSAMNRTNKKKVPRKKSQLHFSVNHDNASNLIKG